jgi:4-aminobutyrate aminotransferase
VPENGFLGGLRRLCDRHGILLVADEVQTGMGRTGKMFACEHWGIVPDIICVAKGVASGLPLGAIIAKAGVMDWPAGKHTSTFGGNPLSCAAALATIDALQGGLIENAAGMGELLLRGLRDIAARKPLIREVRGRGLLIGIELARDGRPAIAERDALLETALRHGLLLLGGGESVVRMCPPLVVSAEEIGIALEVFENALDEVLNERRAA